MAPQLARLMIIFGVLGVLFFIVQSVLQPESFGWYGHYRGKALPEIASNEVKYVQSDICAECHDGIAEQHDGGAHDRISCQTCHNPGNEHVEDPTTENIVRPDPTPYCLRCHAMTSAKPKQFPQIVEADHAGGEHCQSCHLVHNPAEFVE